MKFLKDLFSQSIIIFIFLCVEWLALWSFQIESSTISYIFFMQIFLTACYFLCFYIYKKAQYKQLCEMDAKQFVQIESKSLMQEEVNRMMREVLENYTKSKQKYQKENQDRERCFEVWIHQIKTPIFAMKMLLEYIEDEKRKKQMRQELFKIERYTQMALNVFKMDEDYIIEKCSIEKLVQEAIRTYTLMFVEKGLRLDFVCNYFIVFTDKKWFVFVLEQLLDNAIKYTKEGTIHIHCDNNKISIRDEGCGIKEKDLKQILKKGYTGETGRNSKQASGMGLYFVKEICERLHVKLSFISHEKGLEVVLKPVNEELFDR